MDEMADCVKKGKDMAISIYDMMRCRQPCAEEIPELVTGLQARPAQNQTIIRSLKLVFISIYRK